MKKLILISSILFLFPVALLAQYPDWIQLSNGNNVQALADGENHLWIGTFVGLMKLNKTTGNMTFYNTANSKLPHNWVRALATDKKGNAWIGTGNGLVKLDGSNWEVFQYSWSGQGLPGMYVQALAFDPAGNLWIGSYGLAKFDGTNWTVYQTDNSDIPSDYPDVLAIEANGTVWIADTQSGSGLTKFDGTTWTVYNETNSDLPTNSIEAIAIDHSGNIWAGTDGYGLVKFDGTNWTIYSISSHFTLTQMEFYGLAPAKVWPNLTVSIGWFIIPPTLACQWISFPPSLPINQGTNGLVWEQIITMPFRSRRVWQNLTGHTGKAIVLPIPAFPVMSLIVFYSIRKKTNGLVLVMAWPFLMALTGTFLMKTIPS